MFIDLRQEYKPQDSGFVEARYDRIREGSSCRGNLYAGETNFLSLVEFGRWVWSTVELAAVPPVNKQVRTTRFAEEIGVEPRTDAIWDRFCPGRL